jgi:hypothetical protein
MSINTEPRENEEAILQALHEAVNKTEDKLRHDSFEDLLFHGDYITRNYTDSSNIDELRAQFLAEKKERDFIGRFHMALDPKYLGRIKVIELGLTTKPGENGEFDALKDEYLKLKDWMIQTGIIEEELPRDRCGRFYEVSMEKTVTTERLVVARMRPLVSQNITVTDPLEGEKDVRIDLAKRMAFSIPTQHTQLLAQRYGAVPNGEGLLHINEIARTLNETELKDHIDGLLGHFAPICSIRTAYFMHTEVLGDTAVSEPS